MDRPGHEVPREPSRHDIVVVGASAGGVEAIREVVGHLPADLPAAVFVAFHLLRGSPSYLPEIIARSGPLPAEHPMDGEPIQRGRIYVAPPDHHMVLENGRVRLTHGPHHNRHRPAIDPLFWSAARYHEARVVGVILSGTLDDGTAGLARIKACGGIAIVQDPATAAYGGMPESALAHVDAEVAPLSQIGAAIVAAVELGARPAPESATRGAQGLQGTKKTSMNTNLDATERPSVYACPECHGTLWEYDQDGVLQFRCRVGHSFTADSLLAEHDGSLEGTFWAALRALEENASLRRRLAERMASVERKTLAKRYRDRALESEKHAATLRRILTSDAGSSDTHLPEES